MIPPANALPTRPARTAGSRTGTSNSGAPRARRGGSRYESARSTAASAPTGTFTKNTQRHEACMTIQPPMSGPTTLAAPQVLVSSAWTRARSASV